MLEDLDLTGQEDPVILHAVIAAMPSQTAYREGEIGHASIRVFLIFQVRNCLLPTKRPNQIGR